MRHIDVILLFAIIALCLIFYVVYVTTTKRYKDMAKDYKAWMLYYRGKLKNKKK